MNLGSLDHKITIRQPVITINAGNEQVITYSDFATVWGKRVSKAGAESQQGFERTAIIDTIFTIRYLSGLTDRMIIVDDDGLQYNITFINEIERRKYFQITCFRRDNQNV
jgi:SPP1 family predicted phage head-tail adaptor